MDIEQFLQVVCKYIRSAECDASRVMFSTEDGVHTARYGTVEIVCSTANDLISVRWGRSTGGVSGVYGGRHLATVRHGT